MKNEKNEKELLKELYLKVLLKLEIPKEHSLKLINNYFEKTNGWNFKRLFSNDLELITMAKVCNLKNPIELTKNLSKNIQEDRICNILDLKIDEDNIVIESQNISIYLKEGSFIDLEVFSKKNFEFSWKNKKIMFYNNFNKPSKSLKGSAFMKELFNNFELINQLDKKKINSFNYRNDGILNLLKINGKVIFLEENNQINFKDLMRGYLEECCPVIYNQTGLKEVLNIVKLADSSVIPYIVAYFSVFVENPEIEKVAKSLFLDIAVNITTVNLEILQYKSNDNDCHILDLLFQTYSNGKKSKKIEELFDCPKYILNKIIQNEDYTVMIHYILNILKKEKIKKILNNSNIDIVLYFIYSVYCSRKQVFDRSSIFKKTNTLGTTDGSFDVSEIILKLIDFGYDFIKMIKYIFNLSFTMNVSVQSLFIRIYDMNVLYESLESFCKEKNMENPIKKELYPKKIHDYELRISDLKNLYNDEVKLMQFLDNSREFSKKDAIVNDFIVVSPKTPDDLILEGKLMEHCVGGYVDRYISKTNIVYFLRYKDNPKKPYVTFDIVNNRLNQYVLSKDRAIKDIETLKALKKWCDMNKIKNSIKITNRKENVYE